MGRKPLSENLELIHDEDVKIACDRHLSDLHRAYLTKLPSLQFRESNVPFRFTASHNRSHVGSSSADAAAQGDRY